MRPNMSKSVVKLLPKRRAGLAATLWLALALILGPDLGTATAGQDPGLNGGLNGGLFGTRETRSTNLRLFPKWTGAIERYFDERKLAEAPCASTLFNRCHLREWTAFLAGLRGRDRVSQIVEINRRMNRKRYIVDPRNYGVPDYWATPGQFLRRNGDCEDYAIAKYMSLRALGFDGANMRIVVLQDLNLRIAHAVLVVYIAGETLVLDNQIENVVPASSIRHYRPIYSINENHWWLHQS